MNDDELNEVLLRFHLFDFPNGLTNENQNLLFVRKLFSVWQKVLSKLVTLSQILVILFF